MSDRAITSTANMKYQKAELTTVPPSDIVTISATAANTPPNPWKHSKYRLESTSKSLSHSLYHDSLDMKLSGSQDDNKLNKTL